MKKKQVISYLALFGVLVLGLNLTLKKTVGSHPGSTGAPLDQTCAQSGCHYDAQIIPNATSNTTLSFSSNDTAYIPGKTYTLTLKAKGLGTIPVSKFGFELVAIKDKDSLNTGQLAVTDAVRTQLINHLQGTDTRVSLTHQSAGTPALTSNTTEWSFEWTAPPVNEGSVSFYYAVNCTNDDNLETGDRIYLSSRKFSSPLTTSIKDLADAFELSSYFDAPNHSIHIHYDLKGKREVELHLFDMEGREIYFQASELKSNKQFQRIDVGSGFAKGTYLIQLIIDGQTITKKLLLN